MGIFLDEEETLMATENVYVNKLTFGKADFIMNCEARAFS